MSQIKIYGLKRQLQLHRQAISDSIHTSLAAAIGLPPDKRFHRFIGLDREDFFYPADRSDNYTIIEISMFEGRSVSARKDLIRMLFERLQQDCGIDPHNLEITIFEIPRENWGIRGLPGDELDLNYKINQ